MWPKQWTGGTEFELTRSRPLLFFYFLCIICRVCQLSNSIWSLFYELMILCTSLLTSQWRQNLWEAAFSWNCPSKPSLFKHIHHFNGRFSWFGSRGQTNIFKSVYLSNIFLFISLDCDFLLYSPIGAWWLEIDK